MHDALSRSEPILGKKGIQALQKSHVAVFGAGGVGGYAIEALARSGVGEITVVDNDNISISNLNRQIITTQKNIGHSKVLEAKKRILSINENCTVHTISTFYLPENAHEINLSNFSYIIDAIDTITAKIELIARAYECKTPIISCMGTGNKIDATQFCVADIYKTSTDPIAKILRRKLKERNVNSLKVVYSKEPRIYNTTDTENADSTNLRVPASVSFVPGVAGLILAGEVIKDICQLN